MIEGVWPGGHRLHQRGIADASRHRPAMIVAVEIGGRPIGIAAMRRLEADDP